MTGGVSSGHSGLSGCEIDTPITMAGPDSFDDFAVGRVRRLVGLGLAMRVFSGLAGFSASTSSAGLSVRSPLKAA